MISYIVLEAPGGPDRDHRSTRLIADRFSWLAFLFPWIWFAVQRLWWVAIGLVILQVAAGQVSALDGLAATGLVFAFAAALIAGFEGRNLVVRHLLSRGWTFKTVVAAPDLATAEDMYFASLPLSETGVSNTVPHPDWKRDTKSGSYKTSDPAGSFQFDLNGRR